MEATAKYAFEKTFYDRIPQVQTAVQYKFINETFAVLCTPKLQEIELSDPLAMESKNFSPFQYKLADCSGVQNILFFLSLLLSRPCSFYFLSLPPYHPPSDPTQTTECQMDGESVLRTIDRWKAKPMSISQRHKSKMRYRHVSLP